MQTWMNYRNDCRYVHPSLCFTLKLQSGIEKRMLITLASGYIVYIPTNIFCPLYIHKICFIFVFH